MVQVRESGHRPCEKLEQLAKGFVADTRGRIAMSFAAIAHNNDSRNYEPTQALLEGKHAHLRDGIV